MRKLIRACSQNVTDPAGRALQCLMDVDALRIAHDCQCHVRGVYIEALKLGVCPYRYVRNRDVISPREQLRLAESTVAVIGAGGLGGRVIELLARMGIGRMIIVDHDVFDETNLNRQSLCTNRTLGMPKADIAARTVASINPGVEVDAHRTKIDEGNVEGIISGADVIVDALDNVMDRLTVEKSARTSNIPMVHGALAGFEGRVMTVFPDGPGLEILYGEKDTNEEGTESPEAILGVPAITPSMVASLQVMEVFKILLRRGKIFRNMMLYTDLEYGRMDEFFFEKK